MNLFLQHADILEFENMRNLFHPPHCPLWLDEGFSTIFFAFHLHFAIKDVATVRKGESLIWIDHAHIWCLYESSELALCELCWMEFVSAIEFKNIGEHALDPSFPKLWVLVH